MQKLEKTVSINRFLKEEGSYVCIFFLSLLLQTFELRNRRADFDNYLFLFLYHMDTYNFIEFCAVVIILIRW